MGPRTNGAMLENGDRDKRREPIMEAELLGDDGLPTPFLREAPFLDYGSPMTALERCANPASHNSNRRSTLLESRHLRQPHQQPSRGEL